MQLTYADLWADWPGVQAIAQAIKEDASHPMV